MTFILRKLGTVFQFYLLSYVMDCAIGNHPPSSPCTGHSSTKTNYMSLLCKRWGPQTAPTVGGALGHVSALAATWRVKPVFKPRLSSLPSALFPNKFMLRYGFRPASGAKPKAAYCSTNLMVLWSGWAGDRRD